MEAHYTTLILQINISSLTTKWCICLFCVTLQPFCGRPIFRWIVSPLEYLGGFRIRYECFTSISLIRTFCFLGMSLGRNLLRFCLRGISTFCIKPFQSNSLFMINISGKATTLDGQIAELTQTHDESSKDQRSKQACD